MLKMEKSGQCRLERGIVDEKTCHGCLSVDRTLQPLNGNSELFYKLVEFKKSMYENIVIKLCWECAALLQSVARFQRRVWMAHRHLYWGFDMNRKAKSLSTLRKVQVAQNDYSELDNDMKTSLETGITEDLVTHENIKEENSDFDIADPFISDAEEETSKLNVELLKTLKDEEEETSNVELLKTLKDEDAELPTSKRKAKSNNVTFSKVNTNLDVETAILRVLLRGNEIDDAVNELHKHGWKKKAKWKGKYGCACGPECHEQFDLAVDYRRHITFKHLELESGPQVCLQCDKKCESFEKLKSHWDEHNYFYKCGLCGKFLRTEEKVRSHVTHRHKRVICCKNCKAEFYSRAQFWYHYAAIHKASVCDYCGESFHLKRQVLSHIQNKHGSLVCVQCGTKCSTATRLRQHIANVHESNKEEAYCVECNKQFSSVIRYQIHLEHTMTHTGIRKPKIRLPCPQCDRVYARKLYLNRHIRHAHEKKTAHYCEECDKYYTSAFGLRTHRASVHEKRPKPRNKICHFCGRGFFNNRILHNHVRTHTGERPFACEHCPASFAQKTALTSHTRSAHGQNKKNARV